MGIIVPIGVQPRIVASVSDIISRQSKRWVGLGSVDNIWQIAGRVDNDTWNVRTRLEEAETIVSNCGIVT